MDLEMKLSGYFFKIHTAEAPTRAGGLSAQLTEGESGAHWPLRIIAGCGTLIVV